MSQTLQLRPAGVDNDLSTHKLDTGYFEEKVPLKCLEAVVFKNKLILNHCSLIKWS